MPAEITVQGTMESAFATSGSLTIRLNDPRRAGLRLVFGRIILELKSGPPRNTDERLSWWFCSEGWHLRQFVDELTALREGRRKKAGLWEGDDNDLLNVYVSNRENEEYLIAGRLGTALERNMDDWRDPSMAQEGSTDNAGDLVSPAKWSGCRILFNGFQIREADVFHLAQGIGKHIGLSGLDCKRPEERGPGER